jgi:hypothetical protein
VWWRLLQPISVLSATLAVTLAAAFGCARAGTFDLGGKSRALDQNMSERDVATVLGDDPQAVELRTCGTSTPNPWTCKILMYGDRRYHLQVMFSRADDGTWHVREWSFR